MKLNPYVPTSQVDLTAYRTDAEPLGTIGIPVRDVLNTHTVMSVFGLERHEMPIDILMLPGSILTLQRNALVQNMRGDWILFIDDDMVFRKDTVRRLLASKENLESNGVFPDILGALCFRRQHPFQPTMYVQDGDGGPYNFIETWDEQYIDCDATGMAFALITKQAFERVAETPMPSYEERRAMPALPNFFSWHGNFGEDLRFCQDVKRAGGRIIIDTTIRTGHVGEHVITYRDYLRAIMERPQELAEARRKVNDKMGLPTLTKQEAKKRYAAL